MLNWRNQSSKKYKKKKCQLLHLHLNKQDLLILKLMKLHLPPIILRITLKLKLLIKENLFLVYLKDSILINKIKKLGLEDMIIMLE